MEIMLFRRLYFLLVLDCSYDAGYFRPIISCILHLIRIII